MDELNELGNSIDVEDIVEYFSKMDLTDEQRKDREDMAEKFNDFLLIFLNLIAIEIEANTFNREYLANMLNDRFIEIISETVVVDDYINRYVNQFANDYVDTTYLHMMKDEDKEWWTSSDRAMLTSENESNSVCNYKDFAKAVENGYTKKKWRTEKDNRVRKTHRPLDDKIIDIKKPFQVGNSLMLFPKDKTYFASDRETYNCRCSIVYIK
jgi:uncharacterized protein with gpF-like domain